MAVSAPIVTAYHSGNLLEGVQGECIHVCITKRDPFMWVSSWLASCSIVAIVRPEVRLPK